MEKRELIEKRHISASASFSALIASAPSSRECGAAGIRIDQKIRQSGSCSEFSGPVDAHFACDRKLPLTGKTLLVQNLLCFSVEHTESGGEFENVTGTVIPDKIIPGVAPFVRKNRIIELFDVTFLTGERFEDKAFQKIGRGKRITDNLSGDRAVEPETGCHQRFGKHLIRTDVPCQRVSRRERNISGNFRIPFTIKTYRFPDFIPNPDFSVVFKRKEFIRIKRIKCQMPCHGTTLFQNIRRKSLPLLSKLRSLCGGSVKSGSRIFPDFRRPGDAESSAAPFKLIRRMREEEKNRQFRRIVFPPEQEEPSFAHLLCGDGRTTGKQPELPVKHTRHGIGSDRHAE